MSVNNINRLIRFKGDPCYTEKNINIAVIGLGSIGSRLVRELINIGNFNYFLFEGKDHRVAIENVGVQWYSLNNVGMFKYEALYENARNFGSSNELSNFNLYDEKSLECPIVFIGTDNIKSRQVAFEKWLSLVNSLPEKSENQLIPNKKECIFIDGRLRLWQGECYVVTPLFPSTIQRYRDSLFNEEESPDAACTIKMTSPSATMMSAIMAGQFCNYLARINSGDEDIDTPFSTKFNIRKGYYETKL